MLVKKANEIQSTTRMNVGGSKLPFKFSDDEITS